MIIPTLTDHDEGNYLDILEDSNLVRHAYAANAGYSACVLQYTYPQCQTALLTATTFQILQIGISAGSVQRIPLHRARQKLFDAVGPHFQGNIPKKDWVHILNDENLLPKF